MIWLLAAALTRISVPFVSIEGVDYVPPDSVFPKFGIARQGKVYIASALKRVEIRIKGDVFVLNDNRYRAPAAFYKDDLLYVPGPWMAYILTKVIKGYAYWDTEKKRFFVKSQAPSIRDVRVEDRGDSVCLVVRYRGKVHLRPVLDPGGVSLVSVKLAGGFFWKKWRIKGKGPLTQVDLQHTEKGVVFRVALGEGAGGYNLLDRAGDFVLSIYTTKRLEQPEARARTISLIVLDPGHGGKDPGALGYKNLREKSITLPVALALKKQLERELGVRVILTRDDDRFITLGDRTRIANRAGADLFISLHCNWSKNKKACGTETYFLSEARTDWERSVAAFENKAIEYEGKTQDKSDMVGYIISDMIQNEYLKESQELAKYIQDSLVQITGFENRGVKQAGFYVLRGCYMPAVLVEMAFVSNKHDAKALKDPDIQKKIVQGIVKGVAEFKRRYER